MKRKAPSKRSLHVKIAASVLLKLFISGKSFQNVTNLPSFIERTPKKVIQCSTLNYDLGLQPTLVKLHIDLSYLIFVHIFFVNPTRGTKRCRVDIIVCLPCTLTVTLKWDLSNMRTALHIVYMVLYLCAKSFQNVINLPWAIERTCIIVIQCLSLNYDFDLQPTYALHIDSTYLIILHSYL